MKKDEVDATYSRRVVSLLKNALEALKVTLYAPAYIEVVLNVQE